jgi:RNA polymerase sigma-70 factor, ECF subfamily
VPSQVMQLQVGRVEGEPAEEGTSERLLVSRLRRGDASAFEALVRQHDGRIYDFCVRMLGDPEEAFDLSQDIFLSVHQHLDRFRADAKLSTWLLRIAKNHCLNRLKYLKRRGRGRNEEYAEANELSITLAAGGPARPDEALSAERDRLLVRRAIAELDEDQRMLVVLRDVEGLSYEEIIEVTELAEGTVKSRLHRAREKLAGILIRLQDGEGARGQVEAGTLEEGDSNRAR